MHGYRWRHRRGKMMNKVFDRVSDIIEKKIKWRVSSFTTKFNYFWCILKANNKISWILVFTLHNVNVIFSFKFANNEENLYRRTCRPETALSHSNTQKEAIFWQFGCCSSQKCCKWGLKDVKRRLIDCKVKVWSYTSLSLLFLMQLG